MDLVINMLDEPRVVVPGNQMEVLLRSSHLPRVSHHSRNEFSPVEVGAERMELEMSKVAFNSFPKQATWSHAKMACPMDTPARELYYDSESPRTLGFVSNTTAAADVCGNPAYEALHGFFRGPDSFVLVQNLVPILSQSKPSSFSDILFPNYWYFAKTRSGEDRMQVRKWEDRKGRLYWRGSTTGGHSTVQSWKHHHRQRFVDLVQSKDKAEVYEKNDDTTKWRLQNSTADDFHDLFDVRFTAVVQCEAAACAAMKKHYHMAEREPLTNGNKFLLDMDGNAFSGRYYALLKSGSVIIKQTIFQEWHDERLVPWVHYVPLSMEGTEIFEIMRYFTQEAEEGDEAARRIVDQSREWMGRGLRTEDMQVYLFRLLLELARVMDEDRAVIGYTAPLE